MVYLVLDKKREEVFATFHNLEKYVEKNGWYLTPFTKCSPMNTDRIIGKIDKGEQGLTTVIGLQLS